jgi:hypothetical protein
MKNAQGKKAKTFHTILFNQELFSIQKESIDVISL